MKEQKIENTINLTEKSNAVITYKKAGQEATDVGDGVIIKVSLKLSADMTPNINSDILFGGRLSIFSENLNSVWGVLDKSYRVRKKKFSGTTYNDAYAKAFAYVKTEIEKLMKIIETRKQLLLNA